MGISGTVIDKLTSCDLVTETHESILGRICPPAIKGRRNGRRHRESEIGELQLGRVGCGHLTNSNAADSDVSLALVLRVMRSSPRLEPKTRLWLNPAPVRLYKADESWAEARAGPKVTSVRVTTLLRCMKERSHFCLYVTGFQTLCKRCTRKSGGVKESTASMESCISSEQTVSASETFNLPNLQVAPLCTFHQTTFTETYIQAAPGFYPQITPVIILRAIQVAVQ